MEFSNKLKGNLTEVVSSSIFEDAGYRVVPLGVEKVVREVVTLDINTYTELNLSKTLRYMPDLLITETDMSKAWLVEVKYRKSFNSVRNDEQFKNKLNEQAKLWGTFYVLVYLGKRASGNYSYPGSNCGLIKVTSHEEELHFHRKRDDELVLWKWLDWSDTARIQNVFEKVPDAFKGTPIEMSMRIVKALLDLDDQNV